MQKITYGVIGTGHMGQYHVNVLSQLPGVSFCGIFDVSSEKASAVAAKYHTHAFKSLNEAINNCEAFSVAVPTTGHFSLCRDLINAGKHVLIEKPIAETAEQASEILSLAKKNKTVLHIGHVERFNGAVQELSKVTANPLIWESRRMGPHTGRIRDVGVVMDLMIHDIDICIRVVNSPVIDFSACGTRIPGSKYEDAACAVLRFQSGCIASLCASRVTQEKIRTLSISQPDSYIFLDFTTQDLRIHRQANSAITTSTDTIRYTQEALIERLFIHKENPLQSEIQFFLNSVKKNDISQNAGSADIDTLRLATRITETIRAAFSE